MKHILSADQFTKNDLTNLAKQAYYYRTAPPTSSYMAGKILMNLFYEPSSRTFASFYSAMLRLGGQVIPVQEAGQYSSAVKGESLEDTIRTMQCYADAIVIRHMHNGTADRAAQVARVPIINAGDGTNEHPTQALLDFFTILTERGWRMLNSIDDCLNGLDITIMGDLKHGRTIKSLVKLLRNYKVKMNFVSPPSLAIPQEFVRHDDRQTDDLNHVIDQTDVLYVTRAQLERMDDTNNIDYGVTLDHMTRAKPEMILMHPLPRQKELPTELDADPRSAYFRQMKYGLFMRMAVLESVL